MFAQTSANGFSITGKFTGYPEGTEVRLVRNGESENLASAKIQKGNFLLLGTVKDPVLCYLYIGDSNPFEVYVENNRIIVTGAKEDVSSFAVTGSSSHRDFKDFLNTFVPLFNQLNSLANTINAMVPGPDRDGLMNVYNSTQANIQKQIDKFITEKPKSYVSPFMLNVTSQFYDDPMALEKRFLLLDEKVRATPEGKKLEQFITEAKIGAVGTQALEFSLPDTTGKMLSLSSFRGKYVLLDFWASWCGPCRNENPNVVQNFRRFKNKNFTIFGISLDKPGQKDRWVKAIEEDSLTWNHASDLKFWNNDAAMLYKVHGIPQNFLIDPNGKIIAKNLRGPALEAKLCEIFGCN